MERAVFQYTSKRHDDEILVFLTGNRVAKRERERNDVVCWNVTLSGIVPSHSEAVGVRGIGYDGDMLRPNLGLCERERRDRRQKGSTNEGTKRVDHRVSHCIVGAIRKKDGQSERLEWRIGPTDRSCLAEKVAITAAHHCSDRALCDEREEEGSEQTMSRLLVLGATAIPDDYRIDDLAAADAAPSTEVIVLSVAGRNE